MPVVVRTSAPSASTASNQGRDAGEILETFIRECGDRPPDGLLALRWLNDRYRQIWGAVPWNFAKKNAILQTTAEITSDSVTVTNGSTTVTETTSDGKWTSSVVGREFRADSDNEYYTISAYSNANPDTITLDRAYEGTTGTVHGYTIFQRIYTLANDVGQILTMTDLNHQRPLECVSQQELDYVDPNRGTYGEPRWYAPIGRDSNDIQQVELSFIPDEAYGISYSYVQEAPYITGGEAKLVPQVFQSLLKHGWKADYWHWRCAFEDARGAEQAYAGQEELLFQYELNQMIAREMQNEPPKRMQLANQYVSHRYQRGAGKFQKWNHELP
jgi:hypothetical protein